MITIKQALMMAGFLLALAFGLNLAADSGLIEPDTTKRLMGAVNGLVLVIFANVMPKNLGPLSDSRCGPARGQTYRRFAGWTLFLAGLGYSIVWLTFPLAVAAKVAMAIVASGIVLVVMGVVVIASRGAHSPTEGL